MVGYASRTRPTKLRRYARYALSLPGAAALNALDNLARFAGRQSHWLRAASLRPQGKSGCSGCGKVTRRANHQSLSIPSRKKIPLNPSGKSAIPIRPISPDERGVAHVTKRVVGCGGRGACERRAQAPADGEVVWSWRPDAGAKFAKDALRVWRAMVAREPVTKESSKQAVTPSRREGRIASAEPVCSCAFSSAFCTRDRGCSAHPVFPAPSSLLGAEILANLGHTMPRECGLTSSRCLGRHEPDISHVIARSESDEAIHASTRAERWIASRSPSSGRAPRGPVGSQRRQVE
jgi:hypothetical protein